MSGRSRANPLNARKSSGPRTIEGRRRVSENALRHGLSLPVTLDPQLVPEIERLARRIVGDDASLTRLEAARRISEAQIDLTRIRRARVMLLSNPDARTKKTTSKELLQAVRAIMRGADPEEAVFEADQLILGRKSLHQTPTLEEGFEMLTSQLKRLDRYERRALSRRKFAIREFDQLLS